MSDARIDDLIPGPGELPWLGGTGVFRFDASRVERVCSGYFGPMHIFHAFVACVALTSLTACASEGFEVAAHTQSISYRGHIDSDLITSPTPPACAILPSLSPTTYGGLVPLVDMTFLLSIRKSVPGATIMSPGATMARMNAAGIAGDWQALARDYAASGLLDQARLAKIGKALGVRHLMIPMLATSRPTSTANSSPS